MSGSLWAAYLKEREGKDVLEDADSLISYCIDGDACLIGEIYIRPEKRHGPTGKAIFGRVCDIARAAGCTKVYGTVSPLDRNAVRNLTVLLAIGFTLKQETSALFVLEYALTRET